MEFSKVTVSMSTKTMERLDEFSEEYGINRSASVSMLVNLALSGIKTSQKVDLSRMSKSIRQELLFQLLDELSDARTKNILAMLTGEKKEKTDIDETFRKRIFDKMHELGFEVTETEDKKTSVLPMAATNIVIKELEGKKNEG